MLVSLVNVIVQWLVRHVISRCQLSVVRLRVKCRLWFCVANVQMLPVLCRRQCCVEPSLHRCRRRHSCAVLCRHLCLYHQSRRLAPRCHPLQCLYHVLSPLNWLQHPVRMSLIQLWVQQRFELVADRQQRLKALSYRRLVCTAIITLFTARIAKFFCYFVVLSYAYICSEIYS